MVTDNLNFVGRFDLTMAVMETEAVNSPQGSNINIWRQFSIVIAGDKNDLRFTGEIANQIR